MEQTSSQRTALVEQRLQKLKRLAQEIAAGQEACVALDLEALRNHDHQKEQLCAEIRLLDFAIRREVRESASGRSQREVAADGKLDRLMAESENARAEVARLNRVYALFLARSRGTLKVMANVVSHCRGAYPAPGELAAPAIPATPFERSV